MTTNLNQAMQDVRDAELRLEAGIEAAFPPGRYVHVRHGDNEVPATVVAVYGEHVEVRSLHGKTYQVYAYRIVESGWSP